MSNTARYGDLTPEEQERFINAPSYKGTPKIESQADADRRRLDWLTENYDRLEDVRGFLYNEDGTLRDAIDFLIKRQTKQVTP